VGKTLGLLADEVLHVVTVGVEDPSDMRALEEIMRRYIYNRSPSP